MPKGVRKVKPSGVAEEVKTQVEAALPAAAPVKPPSMSAEEIELRNLEVAFAMARKQCVTDSPDDEASLLELIKLKQNVMAKLRTFSASQAAKKQ
jgi:hypothetical protein